MTDCRFVIVPSICLLLTFIAFLLFAIGPGNLQKSVGNKHFDGPDPAIKPTPKIPPIPQEYNGSARRKDKRDVGGPDQGKDTSTLGEEHQRAAFRFGHVKERSVIHKMAAEESQVEKKRFKRSKPNREEENSGSTGFPFVDKLKTMKMDEDPYCTERKMEEFGDLNNYPITDWHCYQNVNFAALVATAFIMALNGTQQATVILSSCLCGDLRRRRKAFIGLYIIGIFLSGLSGILAIVFGFMDPDSLTSGTGKRGQVTGVFIISGVFMLIIMVADCFMLRIAFNKTPKEIENYYDS